MNRLHAGKKDCLVWFLLMSIFFAVSVLAQSPCARDLAAANQKYGDGDFIGAIVSIQHCLEKTGLAAMEKMRAYALLTKVYIAVEDTAQARRAALELLTIAPNYQPDANDSPEFNHLVEVLRKQRHPAPTPIIKPKKSNKKWWWIGGAVATTAGVAAIMLSRNEPRKQTDTGFTNPPPRP